MKHLPSIVGTFVALGLVACVSASEDTSQATQAVVASAGVPEEPHGPLGGPYPGWNDCRRTTADGSPHLRDAFYECLETCNRDFSAQLDAYWACERVHSQAVTDCLAKLPPECQRGEGDRTPLPAHCIAPRAACFNIPNNCVRPTIPAPDCEYCFDEIDSAGDCTREPGSGYPPREPVQAGSASPVAEVID